MPQRRLVPVLALFLLFAWLGQARAIPEFARRYNLSCAACHAAFPRLNKFGEYFVANNFKLPNWKDRTQKTGDQRLALVDHVPLAVRMQAYAQIRDGADVDPLTGETTGADNDFQAPYLIKLLSGGPLTDHISYYFYAIFAEKGGNGQVVVEDAWFSYDDLFNSGVSMMVGQFQISDLMFPRETRLTFQDFMAYRMAGITYDRGILFGREFGPLSLDVGLVNGNGIEQNFSINSPGFRRPDKLFDNNSSKSVYGRLSGDLGPVNLGLFGLYGQQKNATGPAGTESGSEDNDKIIAGLDASGVINGNIYWFGQFLWNRWEGFLDPAKDYDWYGGFAGVDYVHDDRWTFSALYNYADANDLDDTDTIYEGIDINTFTLTASYYFMRNVKGILEANFDLQGTDNFSGRYYTGHLDNEDYFLIGFDAAF